MVCPDGESLAAGRRRRQAVMMLVQGTMERALTGEAPSDGQTRIAAEVSSLHAAERAPREREAGRAGPCLVGGRAAGGTPRLPRRGAGEGQGRVVALSPDPRHAVF